MGTVIITVQMSSDASIGPDIGWFAGGDQEDAGERCISGSIRMNHEATAVFRGGVILRNYDPVSVEE